MTRRVDPRAVARQRLGAKRSALELQAPHGVCGAPPKSTAGTRSPNASTRRWRETRAAKLNADPECELKLPGCEGAAVEVDHIKQLKDDGDRFAWANLRSVCDACHKQRHGKRKRYPVDVETGIPTDPTHWWNTGR